MNLRSLAVLGLAAVISLGGALRAQDQGNGQRNQNNDGQKNQKDDGQKNQKDDGQQNQQDDGQQDQKDDGQQNQNDGGQPAKAAPKAKLTQTKQVPTLPNTDLKPERKSGQVSTKYAKFPARPKAQANGQSQNDDGQKNQQDDGQKNQKDDGQKNQKDDGEENHKHDGD